MAEILITSGLAFAGTNMDDILILMILFAAAGSRKERLCITAGQYLGMGLLTLISIAGAYGARILPQGYIRFLGILPIFLGIKAWTGYRKMQGWGGRATEGSGVMGIMMLTAANGADNLGVYIPVFSRYSTWEQLEAAAVFGCMTAVWCLAGVKLAGCAPVKECIRKSGHILIPAVLVCLGIRILMGGP